jgi:hypothetical protein
VAAIQELKGVLIAMDGDGFQERGVIGFIGGCETVVLFQDSRAPACRCRDLPHD